MELTDYNQFIQNKRLEIGFAGITVDRQDLNPGLFGFQKDVDRWALRKGRAAIFAGTGLGKTRMQVEWGKKVHDHTGGDVLILAPLAVAAQTVREGAALGYEITLCRSQDDVRPGLNITNYEMLHHFEPLLFTGVVLDECFPANTLVDVVCDGKLQRRCISDMMVGDTILNAIGVDEVAETHKRRINRAVQINAGGRITSSENHPFFTLYGWRSAKDLQPGDYIMATETAMRLVRDRILPDIDIAEVSAVLREILLSEMENETRERFEKGPHQGSPSKDWKEKERLVQEWLSDSFEGVRADSPIEPHGQRGNTEEDFYDVTGDEPQTFRAWGKWEGDEGAKILAKCSARELDYGITYITGKTKTGIPNLLQSRFRQSRLENSNRNRRQLALFEEEPGQEEGRYAGFVRVESVEIMESSDTRLDEFRDKDGNLYFYDIKAKRHPSFSVNGLLVHNSSILKSFTGKMRTDLIEAFAFTPYRLACTATPAPNDYMEIGNHAEFLGIMSRSEMLSMFFVHDGGDTQKWRLKGHAEADFWAWVASWGVVLEKPSDLGYEDGAFQLPPLNMHEIIVPAEGPLAKTLTERRQARKDSLQDRVEKCAELVNSDDDTWLVWCDLNDESDALTKTINEAIEVRGSHSPAYKEKAMLDFAAGNIKRLVSKSSICGFGLNFQVCHKMAFVGLSDSFEQMFQAVRRCWRFGQAEPVDVYIITAETEGAVLENIKRKEQDFRNMVDEMVKHTQGILSESIRSTEREVTEYTAQQPIDIPWWLTEQKTA